MYQKTLASTTSIKEETQIYTKQFVWGNIKYNAIALAQEPLAGLRYHTLASKETFEDAYIELVALSLATPEFPANAIAPVLQKALDDTLIAAAIADLAIIVENDPSIEKTPGGAVNFLEPFAWWQGFHALEGYRFAHAIGKTNTHTAHALRYLSYKAFATDIHFRALIAPGVQIDHAVGLVVGETATVGQGSTLFHGVTLGARGDQSGKRHPDIGENVLVSAHTQVIGAISVGDNAKTGAGSIVTKPVGEGETVLGFHARNKEAIKHASYIFDNPKN